MQATMRKPPRDKEASETGIDVLKVSELKLETDVSDLKHGLTLIPEMGNVSALTDVILLLFNNKG